MASTPDRPVAVIRPSPRARLLIHLTGAGLWLSGGLWLLFHYFLRREGPWGPEPHVLEPWWLRFHGAFAFAALWTTGLIWGLHIARAWTTGRRRWTGVGLLGAILLLSITGFLLLHVSDDGLQGLVSPIHWIVGLVIPIAYVVHRSSR